MAGYGDDSGLAAYLASQGYTLPETAPDPAILRQRGSDYVDGLYGARFRGVPTDGVTQERAWPRTGATAYGSSIADDLVPTAVIYASYAAAWYEANNPGGLSVSATAAGAVKREKVGPLETEYFGGDGNAAADATVRLSAVEGLLAPFLLPETPMGGLGIWVV